MSVHQFATEQEYYRWLGANPQGYVLSIRREGPLLHRATCTNINRHNNPGALVERGTPKWCATSKQELRAKARAEGLIPGIVLDKCANCGP